MVRHVEWALVDDVTPVRDALRERGWRQVTWGPGWAVLERRRWWRTTWLLIFEPPPGPPSHSRGASMIGTTSVGGASDGEAPGGVGEVTSR
jgi:hypothetical protein